MIMMLMNSVNLERKCRICAGDLLDITCAIPIFADGIALDAKIQRYLYITVNQNDELPKVICATCFIKIESIDKFAYLAAKTEETYFTWLKRAKEMNLMPIPPPAPSTPTESEAADADPNNRLILKTYRNPRNPRHVDHITLEQIINDQIVRNPKVLNVPLECPKLDPSSIAFHDLKIGQLIKDEELLKLMLKALKWMELGNRRYTGKYWLKKLKGSKFNEVLSNPNLLNDSDLLQLLKSYMGQDALTLLSQAVPLPASFGIPSRFPPTMFDDDVTQMEVGVDPALFLDDDSRLTPEVRNDGKFLCSMCPETFLLNSELQNHVLTHLLSRQVPSTSKKRKRRTKGGVLQDSGNLPNEVPAKKGSRSKKKAKLEVAVENAENVPSPKEEPPKVEIIRIPPGMNPALLNLEEDKKEVKKTEKVEVKKEKPDLKKVESEKKVEPTTKQEKRKRKQRIKVKDEKVEVEAKNTPIIVKNERPTRKKKEEKPTTTKRSRKRVQERTQSKVRVKAEHKSTKFACDKCQKSFSSKSNLMSHILSHALEKRHKCTACKKVFSGQKQLKIHMASHNTSERSFTCTHCSKNFATANNQLLHEKRMHGDPKKS